MSKGRWDRNPAARQQRWESDYVALGGGLDQRSSAMTIKPTRMVQALNVEEVFGQQGYNVIKGYERFNGAISGVIGYTHQYSPSYTKIWYVPFTNGDADLNTFVPGDIVTRFSGSVDPELVYITKYITSGTTAAGTAAGYIVGVQQNPFNGNWSAGNNISLVATQAAVAAGPAVEMPSDWDVGIATYETAKAAVDAYLLPLITPPSGIGPILGGCVYNNAVYVVRTHASGDYQVLYRSTSAGWVVARTTLPSGPTRWRFAVANFTGDPSRQYLYMVSGRGRLMRIDTADVVTYAPNIYLSEGLSTTAVIVGTGAKSFTTETGRSWIAGDGLIARHRTSGGITMTGTVTSYNTATGALVLNVTSNSTFGATLSFSDWDISKSDFSDRPYMLTEYKNHMWMAYPNGQLQTSALGDPLLYTGGTVAAFGLGQTITGMSSLKGKRLAIFCEGKIDVIDGTNSTDWAKDSYTDKVGAIADSIQDNDGNPIFLSQHGLLSLEATQNFGDLSAMVFSRDVQQALANLSEQRRSISAALTSITISAGLVATRIVNNQYRAYFVRGQLRFTLLAGGGGLTPKTVSPTYASYTCYCAFQGLIGGVMRTFFGTSTGVVMEEDAGTTFDGTAFDWGFRLPFNHYRSPAIDKQFHKGELEVAPPSESGGAATFLLRQEFDYNDGTFTPNDVFAAAREIAANDVADVAYTLSANSPTRVELDLDGQARNMSLVFHGTNQFAQPFGFQGITSFFTKLGLRP